MNRGLVVPLIKLSICCAALIATLILSFPSTGGDFRGVAIAAAIIVVGPVTLLVAIDFGRALRQQPISPSAKWLSLLPQRTLGGIACLAGIGGLCMALYTINQPVLLRILYGVLSVGIGASGIAWIRDTRPAAKPGAPHSLTPLAPSMRRTLAAAGKLVVKTLLAIALVFFAYGGWYWWDMHRLRSFCADIHAGLPVADLRGIAERHWINERYLRRDGVFDEKTKTWFLPVPAASTMGDMVCAIHHNNGIVISADVWGP